MHASGCATVAQTLAARLGDEDDPCARERVCDFHKSVHSRCNLTQDTSTAAQASHERARRSDSDCAAQTPVAHTGRQISFKCRQQCLLSLASACTARATLRYRESATSAPQSLRHNRTGFGSPSMQRHHPRSQKTCLRLQRQHAQQSHVEFACQTYKTVKTKSRHEERHMAATPDSRLARRR